MNTLLYFMARIEKSNFFRKGTHEKAQNSNAYTLSLAQRKVCLLVKSTVPKKLSM